MTATAGRSGTDRAVQANLVERAQFLFLGGVNSPVRAFRSVGQPPLVLEAGRRGTEVAISALRVARGATGRDLVLKFAGGYHGHSDGLLVEAGSGVATLALPGSAGVPAAMAAETIAAAGQALGS